MSQFRIAVLKLTLEQGDDLEDSEGFGEEEVDEGLRVGSRVSCNGGGQRQIGSIVPPHETFPIVFHSLLPSGCVDCCSHSFTDLGKSQQHVSYMLYETQGVRGLQNQTYYIHGGI